MQFFESPPETAGFRCFMGQLRFVRVWAVLLASMVTGVAIAASTDPAVDDLTGPNVRDRSSFELRVPALQASVGADGAARVVLEGFDERERRAGAADLPARTFLVAIPFVALGSFMVIDMAKGSLQVALGQSFEQRATETKLLIERYVAAQIVHSRLLALDPEVRLPLRAPAKGLTNAESGELEQRWVAGDAKLTEAIVGSSLASRLKAIMTLRPEVRLIQVIDGAGRVAQPDR